MFLSFSRTVEETWGGGSSAVKDMRQREGVKLKGKGLFPRKHCKPQCRAGFKIWFGGVLVGQSYIAPFTQQPGEKLKNQRNMEKGKV